MRGVHPVSEKVFSNIVRSVEELEDKMKGLEKSVEERASKLLEIADTYAVKVRDEADKAIEEAKDELKRSFEERAGEIEEQYKRRMRETEILLQTLGDRNKERAIRAVLERLREVISGG